MSIIFPVQAFDDPQANADGNFAGATALEGELTVLVGGRATFASATTLNGGLSVEWGLSGTLEGSSVVSGALRLNDEANVFLSGTLDGETQLSVRTPEVGTPISGAIDGGTALAGDLGVVTAEEISFSFIVDVRNPAATTALAKNIRRFNARLKVNGTVIPIKSATLNAPPDTLGTELSVELARPDVSLIPLTASVDFELGIWTGNAFAYEKLLTGARLSGRSKRVINNNGLPADVVTVTFVDIVGDKWNLRPEAQTLYYDPTKVDRPAPSASGVGAAQIKNQSGAPVATVEVASVGLNLYEVLRLAYVVGCDFSAVKTNIPNFPVEQVSFTLTGGYDAGVRGLLTPFTPVVFAVGSVLWIVDPDIALPAGLMPKELRVNRFVEVTSTLPNREPVDGILVTIKVDRISGEYFTERLEVEHTPSTVPFGSSGFTITDTERRIREYRTLDAPAVIRREVLASLKTTVTDAEGKIISRETQTDDFDGLNRKTGHQRISEQRLPDVADDGNLRLQTISEERQSIVYGAHPLKPAVDTILRIETHTDGLILIDNDNQYLNKPYRLPLADAHKAGGIDADANQATEFGAIKSKFEYLRVRGQSVEMETRFINHITNAPDGSSVTTRPGADEMERTSQATQSILLTLPGATQKRRVAEFDGTGLPSAIALDMAARKLRKLANPPLECSGGLAYPDSALRRGSILNIKERDDVTLGTHIATSYQMNFRREGGALLVSGSVLARYLTT